MHTLFIPGPTWVDDGARVAMSGQMMPHRAEDFVALYEQSQPILRAMAGTQRPVYLATCSSWGMMEAVLRNTVRPRGRVLNCCCGAFSDRWHDVARRCGLQADALRVPWGETITPNLLADALSGGSYDLVTLVHAETSTGVLNPLQELSAVVRAFPSVLLAVDVVSSYSAVPLQMDQWGIDVVLAGTQKALALPPGMTICAVSNRAIERAKSVEERGFYLDFLEYERQARSSMTISTPNIPLVMGLAYRAREIEHEGLATRYERHAQCSQFVRDWAENHGWASVPPRGREATTLSCLRPKNRIDTVAFAHTLQEQSGFVIDSGYGQWKGACIRISNMGVMSPHELTPLIHGMLDAMTLFP
ncbi:MAG: alanine--glyoxylate aminotransferase family protein [Akkermansia sp.]